MTNSDYSPIKRALISVSDKSGIPGFARALAEQGVEIISTGGTARLLAEEGIAVTEVSQYTEFPEMMDGRLKTLHPKVHGGILGRRGIDDQVMVEQGIAPIDMVVVNLYPFEKTIRRSDATLADAIENIDIGGPAMIRAAAKNHTSVAVVVSPSDYEKVIEEIRQNACALSSNTRLRLANKAFAHTARYDGAIANYLGQLGDDGERAEFPTTLSLQFEQIQLMRYGENPHQAAAFFREPGAQEASVTTARQLQGKELSYNNVADTDAALECVKQFDQPCCVIVKHANPCGVAVANNLRQAYERAFSTDPTSAFGGIIAFNGPLDGETANAIVDRQFVEVVIAPEITQAASDAFNSKANVRVLECGPLGEQPGGSQPERGQSKALDYKRVTGGLLVQERDLGAVSPEDLRVVSDRAPSRQELDDLLFAWRVAKFVKSNAIVYARERCTVGVGAGQMSRVYSAKIAAIKAADEGLEVSGAVMASDAFFPFRDGIDAANQAGIVALIQPGGSMRDQEVIEAANEYGMAMVFTGMRHFRH